MAAKKVFTIKETHHSLFGSGVKERFHTGTLEELTEKFSYTLECGKSWEYERGNKKISMKPRTIDSLCKNLTNARNNCARNGYSGDYYEVVEQEVTA